MCIAFPMEIISLTDDGKKAVCSSFGNKLQVDVSMIDAKIGDHVLVHAGIALQIMIQSEAEEINGLLSEIKAIYDD